MFSANLYHGEYWNCHPVARMHAWRRLRHWSMPSSITLCYTPTHASNRCCLIWFTSCAFCGRLAAPDFAMKCTKVRAVRWSEVWKFYSLLHICTFGLEAANDAQNVRADTAHGKDKDQQNFIKNDNVILQRI